MRAPLPHVPRPLTLACAVLSAFASRSSAEKGPRLVGPVVEAVARGEVSRAAVLARKLVGSAPGRPSAQLRMLLTEHRPGLLTGLEDPQGEVRAACAWALGWIRDWESAAEVERLLADAEAEVRREAARALGEFGEKRFAASLVRASADADPGVRRSALASLARLGTGFEAGVRALEDDRALDDESDDVRHAAVSLLCDVPTTDPELERRAARALAGAAESARWDIRFGAAVALGRLRIEDGVEALLGATRDPDERVVLAAITALGDIGGEKAAQALVRIAAGTPQAPRPLVRGAVESLGRSGVRSAEVVEALSRVVREGPVELAPAAADALAALGGETARKALVDASRSDRKEIHGAVAEAAARLGEYRPAAVLLRDLDDEDEWVALGAARSLADIGNPAGFPVFISALRSEDERVRAFAATCLALYSGAHMDLWPVGVGEGAARERERIAREWRNWWLRNRDTFVVRRVGRGLAR